MAADHLQFLKDKFITDFKEAGDEFGSELPLRLHFQQIQEVLQEKIINNSTPIQMKNSLYDLRYLLAECILSAEKERELETQNKKSHFNTRTLKKLWFLRKIGKKLIRIKRKLQQITNTDPPCEDSLQPDSITVLLPEDIRPLNESKIHGFDAQLQKIEALLSKKPENDGIKAIGLVGMSGVGKTTLLRLVLHKCVLSRKFSTIIWVTLSEKANPLEIVSHIFRHLGVNYDLHESHDLHTQVSELYNWLFGRKYLIVLDNVCHVHEWFSNLGSDDQDKDFSYFTHGLPKGGRGAIIVTTRFEDVAIGMVGEQNLLRLEPTFDAEALWRIVMDSIQMKKFLSWDNHLTLLRMKDEIIDRCDGLPLAAKTLAEIISIQLGKQEYWSDSGVKKEFCLRFELPDHLSYWNVEEKVNTLPGVHEVFPGAGDDKMRIVGRCDLIETTRELGKFMHTELISVSQIKEEERQPKLGRIQRRKELRGWRRFLRLYKAQNSL